MSDEDINDPETWFSWARERWGDDPLAATQLQAIGYQVQAEHEDTERPRQDPVGGVD